MIEMNPSRIVWGGSQKEILKEKWANKFKNIKDITITQEDINDYISEAKNRYKIYR